MEKTRTSPVGSRGFGLLEVLIALALMGAGVAAVVQLVRLQGDIQARARLHGQALLQARNIMSYWLDQPDASPGIYQGDTAGGMSWEVRIADLSRKFKGEKRQSLDRNRRSRRVADRVPDLLGVSVCCRYKHLGRVYSLCLDSRRLAVLESRR